MALELNTYGDLKKVIKAITLKQKGEKIGNIALGTLMGFIPGAEAAKTTFDFIKAAISKPDTKKTKTWLDKLDIDDEMSAIVDDTVENGFMQMMSKTIESKPDTQPLEPDFNMNAEMVNYLKDKYEGRTVSGIQENREMNIKEYIKDIVREIISEEEIDEMSTSGAAGAYSTPYAFKGNKKGENAATKAAISQGFKKASTSLPKNSKILDYKQLFEDEYEMVQDPKTKEFSKRVKLSDEDKETVKKIQALMAKEKSLKPNIKESIEEIVKEEILKEGTYSKFKNEVKLRSKNEQLHKAIKEVKRKLMEIDRIVEYTSMMKQELSEGEEGLKYWKATTNNVSKIAEMVNELNTKIQNLQQ
jgi:hypothetical protein